MFAPTAGISYTIHYTVSSSAAVDVDIIFMRSRHSFDLTKITNEINDFFFAGVFDGRQSNQTSQNIYRLDFREQEIAYPFSWTSTYSSEI